MIEMDLQNTMQRSDPAGWLDRHGDALFRYAMLRLRDEHLAEELVQETLLAGMAATCAFAGRSAERTWLIGILRHKLVDALRRRRRQADFVDEAAMERHVASLFTKSGKWAEVEAAARHRPERRLAAADFRRAFEECLEALPARAAAAFVLTELDGWDGPRVCEALGVSAANYWAIMSRARLHLRQCLIAKDVLERTSGSDPC